MGNRINNHQKEALLAVLEKLANVSFVMIQEIKEDEFFDVQEVYDIAFALSELESKCLTIPHMKDV
jgi:hypothetical protein